MNGFAKGNYTISAYATLVPGETDITDNNCTDGNVLVTVSGDVNGDRKVDSLDLDGLAGAYGSTSTSANWNPEADINNDGLVDVFELKIIGSHWGQSWHELYYDDGVAEGEYATSTLPHYRAVLFHAPTVGTYKLEYVKYYITSDSASFELQIRDSLAQIIYSEVVTPTDVGWFVVDLSSQYIYIEGDFYARKKCGLDLRLFHDEDFLSNRENLRANTESVV